jgi:thiamine-monophosphate kinase
MSSTEKNWEEPTAAGRYNLIEQISAKTGIAREETSFGTATVEVGTGLLVSQNLMLEGIDFNLMYFPMKHLGYKLVVRTIAGIYASGGTPSALSVNVALSSRFGPEQTEELFGGITLAAKKYNTKIRYFDLTSSLTGMTLACTAWGSREGDAPAARKPSATDLICVTGDLGAAYIGLQILERERRIFESGADVQPDLSDFQYVISRQLKPELRTEVLAELAKAGIAPSVSTVIREGLASELLGVCKNTSMGCRLFYEKIPVDSDTYRNAEEIGIDPVVAALNGGEEYEFLFIAPVAMAGSINKVNGLTMIGYLTDASEGCLLVTPGDEVVELRAQGWSK